MISFFHSAVTCPLDYRLLFEVTPRSLVPSHYQKIPGAGRIERNMGHICDMGDKRVAFSDTEIRESK